MTMRMILVIALLAYIARTTPPDEAPDECATDTCVQCVYDCMDAREQNPRALPSET